MLENVFFGELGRVRRSCRAEVLKKIFGKREAHEELIRLICRPARHEREAYGELNRLICRPARRGATCAGRRDYREREAYGELIRLICRPATRRIGS